MRRAAAMALLLLFSAVLALPLLPAEGAAAAPLPACCRTHGQHHCMMHAANRTNSAAVRAPSVSERCPYRDAKSGWQSSQHFSLPPSATCFAEALSHPAQRMQVSAGFRISAARTHGKRGPPALS